MPLAAARAGLIHVPVNPLLKGAQVAHILSDRGAKLLVTNSSRADMLGDGRPEDCTLHDMKIAEEVIDSGGQGLQPSLAESDALAAILYTRGSPRRQKGVLLSHAKLWRGTESDPPHLKPPRDD